MDIQTPLICAGVVAFSAAVVYLTSILAIRERTYEEAIEEQRQRSSFDANLKTAKIDKPKKDKKEKTMKRANKKVKAEKWSASEVSDAKQVFELNNSDHNQAAIRKIEHNVEFKAEPEIVETIDVTKYQKPVTASKPSKPILVNKIEAQEVPNIMPPKQRNSFDLIIPKDELEMLKESKKLYETELIVQNEVIIEASIAIASEQTKPDNDFNLNRFSNSNQTETNGSEVSHEFLLKTDVSNNLTHPQKKAKKPKTSHTSVDGNNKEFSAKVITNIIKSTSLTNEEIQLLTDALLNKQSDGSTEWRKKNDPMAMVKKQLQEKELALEAEMKNCEAAVLKNRELRQELASEKAKQLNNREKSQQMQQEVHSLQLKLQQNYDNHRSEVKSLQNQLQQLQVKISEDRNVIIQLKDENSRMQQLLKSDQHLKHEIEQLRNERQQYDIRMSNTQKVNEDLLRKTQQYDTHINSLSEKIQSDEMSYQKLVNDVKQELQMSESQRISLVEELNIANNNRSAFESDSIQLRNRFDEQERTKNEELARLLNDISELSREKKLLETALSETEINRQQNGELKKEDNEKLNKLTDELNYTKEELRNLKNELENQIQKNEELKEKNRVALESLENNERVKNECVDNAVKVTQELSNQKFMNELEALKIENESKNCDLNKAKNTLETYMQQILLVKEVLRNIFPSFDPNDDNWVETINSAFVECKNQQQTYIVVLEQQLSQKIDEANDIFKKEQQKSGELEVKVTQYTKALSDTETILSDLQTKIEDKEKVWKLEEQKYQNEAKKLTDDCNRLCDENEVIKSNLNQIDNLRATIEQMENQQKQMRSNLENEIILKQQLEIKFDEVNKDVADLRDKLSQKNNEIELFLVENLQINEIKKECEELRNLVEKERKISKELSTQNVRLNSLVKIGTESLKMEEEKVKQLEAQLNLNNGSLSVNCPAANGSSESIPPSNTINTICDSNDEYSTFTNQTPLLPTNNKSLKTKRRGASVKK